LPNWENRSEIRSGCGFPAPDFRGLSPLEVMNDDEAWFVQQTTDGGYILAGCTDYYETDNCDALLIKVRR